MKASSLLAPLALAGLACAGASAKPQGKVVTVGFPERSRSRNWSLSARA